MARWKVTVRSGPEVNRTGHETLDRALADAREKVEEIVAGAPLGEVKAIRDYGPAQRIKGRVEISGKGLFRPPTGGVDIRGDNSTVGYTGAVRRRALKDTGLDRIFRELGKALRDE